MAGAGDEDLPPPMEPLAPDDLLELGRQMAFLSAFLGGFAATFLATLLPHAPGRRSACWTVAASALSAVAFVVAVLAGTMLSVTLHPHAPAHVTSPGALERARLLGVVSFLVGIFALLTAVGCSGWIRSRRAGLFTSLTAAVGAVCALAILAGS